MEQIRILCDEIIRLASPSKIILFSQKASLTGDITSFKLCIVAEGNAAEIEGEIYLKTDCALHYDVLVYSAADWARLIFEPDSFAARINDTGSVLYDSQQ